MPMKVNEEYESVEKLMCKVENILAAVIKRSKGDLCDDDMRALKYARFLNQLAYIAIVFDRKDVDFTGMDEMS